MNRFEIKQIGDGWVVIDTASDKVMSFHRNQQSAQAHANKLNLNPPNISAKRIFDHKIANSVEDLENVLDLGFEPYALDSRNRIFCKRKIIRGNPNAR